MNYIFKTCLFSHPWRREDCAWW